MQAYQATSVFPCGFVDECLREYVRCLLRRVAIIDGEYILLVRCVEPIDIHSMHAFHVPHLWELSGVDNLCCCLVILIKYVPHRVVSASGGLKSNPWRVRVPCRYHLNYTMVYPARFPGLHQIDYQFAFFSGPDPIDP